MPQVSHINWPEFPLLTARLKEIEVKLAQGVALSHLYSEQESSSILAGIRKSVNSITVETCQTAPVLDEFLDRIGGHFVSNYSLAGLSPEGKGLIQAVNQVFLSKPCGHCGAAPKCDLSSDLTNARAVHEFGQCFRLLREMFDFVVELCHQFYGRCANTSAPAKLALHTEPLGQRNPILDLAISGQTRQDSEHERSIIISILVSEFGLSDYFACLYIMFHECFVHGWCGTLLDSAEASWSDSFHEGWMDCVGFKLLEERLGADPMARKENFWQHAADFLKGGAKARDRRLNFETPVHRNAARYATADAAAESLLTFFRVVLEDSELARAAFFRFSMELNSSSIDDRQRRLLVVNVQTHLSGKAATRTFINNGALSSEIEQFARGGDMRVLLSVLNSIHYSLE